MSDKSIFMFWVSHGLCGRRTAGSRISLYGDTSKNAYTGIVCTQHRSCSTIIGIKVWPQIKSCCAEFLTVLPNVEDHAGQMKEVTFKMLSTKSNKEVINCLLCAYNSCISFHPLLVKNIIMCQNASLGSALPWMFLLHPPLETGEQLRHVKSYTQQMEGHGIVMHTMWEAGPDCGSR